MHSVQPFDLQRLRIRSLSERDHMTRVDEILLAPDAPLRPLSKSVEERVGQAVEDLRRARALGATAMLIYGAHLLRNGASLLLRDLMEAGWLTHLATNGAGTIHDWEYAHWGASTESVERGVASGTFGIWNETALNIHLAVMTGALDGLGYGGALGRFICDDGCTLPESAALCRAISEDPEDAHVGARAELLQAMRRCGLQAGRHAVAHPHRRASIIAAAWEYDVPFSVHPGIGYDIISNHPIFSGAAIGRAAEWDFKLFGGSLSRLQGGVTLSVGSAIMGPQVFEKALSCVNNLRLQDGETVVDDHAIYVVDLQDGGGWDWRQGEPPKTEPAYYLRFCKSFSRMGGRMQYVQSDNAAFVQHLHRALMNG